MGGWRPTAAEVAAIRIAIWLARAPDWVPADDLRQAALIYLWTHPPRSQDRAYLVTVLHGAVVDEIRRHAGGYWGRPGYDPERSRAPREADDSTPDYVTPESWLQAKQGLRILFDLPAAQRRAVAAMVESDTRKEAAARIGVSASRFTRLLETRAPGYKRPSVRERLAEALESIA